MPDEKDEAEHREDVALMDEVAPVDTLLEEAPPAAEPGAPRPRP